MPEYIEREKVLKTLEEIKTEKEKELEKRIILIDGLTTVFNELCAIKSVIKIIKKDIPAADVVPAVHAAWIFSDDGSYPYCSNCIEKSKDGKTTPFCPNCGVKMIKSYLPSSITVMNTCICCGEIIPEGRQVCPKCEKGEMHDKV